MNPITSEVIQYYKNKKNGYFVDIGSGVGDDKISPSFLLEKDYQWKGLCVEKDPFILNDLKYNRKKSICLNKYISDVNHYNKYVVDHEYQYYSSSIITKKVKITTDSITINELLTQNQCPHFIHYLSINVENNEDNLLNVVDFKRFKFGMLSISFKESHEEKEKEKRIYIENHLKNHGYTLMKSIHHSDLYKNNLL